VMQRDRLGQWTKATYDALRQLTSTQDELGRIQNFSWCKCGSLSKFIDPMGRITEWRTDAQSRVSQKIFPDGTKTLYTYENTTSRLKEITDAKGQTKQYQYFKDDNLKQVTYADAEHATSTLSYTYDSIYDRIATLTDGTGTTTFDYYAITDPAMVGAGRLESIDGPAADDTITFVYDELDRLVSRSVDGATTGLSFDNMGRVTGTTSELGTSTRAYRGVTKRLSRLKLPNDQQTFFSYLPKEQGNYLYEIKNLDDATGVISKFNYAYRPDGLITSWKQQADSDTPVQYDLAYDAVGRLLTAVLKNTSTSAILKQFVYGYRRQFGRTVALQRHGHGTFDGDGGRKSRCGFDQQHL
jgi:YD repeat-containing protein